VRSHHQTGFVDNFLKTLITLGQPFLFVAGNGVSFDIVNPTRIIDSIERRERPL
jgi:hypothetical protein